MIQNVWFDAAATLAMGEAFDNACKSLQKCLPRLRLSRIGSLTSPKMRTRSRPPL